MNSLEPCLCYFPHGDASIKSHLFRDVAGQKVPGAEIRNGKREYKVTKALPKALPYAEARAF